MGKTLFLFSKTFPYGEGEQYIENELPFLATEFEKVVIYPADWFGKETVHNKKIPANVEILNFNAQLQNTSGDLVPALKLTLSELTHSPNLSKEISRPTYLLNIAKHQIHTAKNFEILLKENYSGSDLFFYTYWSHNATLMLSILKMRRVIQSYITRGHSIDLYGHNWALAASLKVPAFEYTRFKYVDRIFTVSKHAEDFFREKFPAWRDKTQCSYLGIPDMGVNKPQSEVFTLVTCSNLSFNKRMSELAKAIKTLDIPLHWIHFGDGEQRAEIEKIAGTLPPHQKIIIKGNTPNEEVRLYMAERPVDVFVNLSIVEGLPVSIMEAISAGIPVLATNVYGNPEIVIEGRSGITIPSDFTTQQLSEAIKTMYNNPLLRQSLRKGARALYEERFTAKKNYSEFTKELLKYPNKIN